MASKASSTRWATREDWLAQRDLITELYDQQNLTLRKVMQIMEEEHDFHATERMYRARFAQWGLQKNLKYKDVGDVLTENVRRQRASEAAAKEQPLTIRGRKIDEKRVLKYLRRLPADRHRQLEVTANMNASAFRCSGNTTASVVAGPPDSTLPSPPMSVVYPLATPDDLRLPEICMRNLENYISGAFEMGIWQIPHLEMKGAPRPHAIWSNHVYAAVTILDHGDTKQAFHILASCFDQIKGLISMPDPWLFLYIYRAVADLSKDHVELARSFLQYVESISRVVHKTDSHPLHVVLTHMQQMGPTRTMEIARHLTQTYASMMQDHLKPGVCIVPALLFSTRMSALYNLLDCDVAETTIERIGRRLDHYTDPVFRTVAIAFLKLEYIQMYLSYGLVQEARKLAVETLEIPRELLLKHPTIGAICYRTLFLADIQERASFEQVKSSARRWIAFCKGNFRPGNTWTVQALISCEPYIRDARDSLTADQICCELDGAIKGLCNSVREMRIV